MDGGVVMRGRRRRRRCRACRVWVVGMLEWDLAIAAAR